MKVTHFSRLSRTISFAAIPGVVLFATGCQPEGIREYTVKADEHRILAPEVEVAVGKDLTWTVPEGWERMEDRPMRVATYRREMEEAPVEWVVSRFPGVAGEPLPNVNRWRQQLGLRAVNSEELLLSRWTVPSPAGETQAWMLPDPELDTSATLPAIGNLVGIHYTETDSWFFRLSAPAHLIPVMREDFDQLLVSLAVTH